MGPRDFFITFLFVLFISTGLTMATSGHSEAEFWVARSCFLAAALAVTGGYWYWLQERKQSRRLTIIFGIVAAFWCVAATPTLMLWVNQRVAYNQEDQAPSKKPPPLPEAPPKLSTFSPADIFERDTQPSLTRIVSGGRKELRISRGAETWAAACDYKVIFERDARISDIYVFIPARIPTDIAANEIAKNTRRMLASTLANIPLIGFDEQGRSPTMLSDFRFSGNVYIYQDVDISPKMTETLERLFTRHGLHLEFRGTRYILSRGPN